MKYQRLEEEETSLERLAEAPAQVSGGRAAGNAARGTAVYSVEEGSDGGGDFTSRASTGTIGRLVQILAKYARFIGPGMLVSVAYMDPGNFSTAVAAGSAHRYQLLFSVLVSNILAAFWQCLCAKLGAVTGLDLAQNCRKYFPHNVNVVLYALAEMAIIATDLAEVVGTAISLNILFGVPLPLGVVLTVVDVLVVLMAYNHSGSLRMVRWFEMFVSLLVMLTVICFTVELFSVPVGSVKQVFAGFLPSRVVFEGDGLYLSLAILGATVMPHSLYLGSGVVQPRLRDFDTRKGHYVPSEQDVENNHSNYKPSLDAINETMHYTVAELLVSLFTVALFVNCSILIVSGATLYGKGADQSTADLFSIYTLLCDTLSKAAGTIFVLALLFSGQSAGIVCTLSGQMVSEGFLNWTLAPSVRRTLTRAVAITPCLILVLVTGRTGLSAALNASQVVLSLLLPFVSAPLLYFTSNKEIMRVPLDNNCYHHMPNEDEIPLTTFDLETNEHAQSPSPASPAHPAPILYKDMSNSPLTTVVSWLVWFFISSLNFYLLASFASGKDVHL
ncbi:divalent metal ion transporter SMF2 Ecym_8264 [Eremothecium cymbalariae DBVPG|uniref:Uncharacterized protein n=1 Tax=Eremothecium cymbalariae (strain CBS 270.75 / DBVPG 7215 / KCTC 17166 / NRRL Y-17582) TaxID=931890 RepID=G8JXH2_ERECY|nr:Hypothetical protein Ecym_8264 [Eremothecium cymbalariae DBVPG\